MILFIWLWYSYSVFNLQNFSQVLTLQINESKTTKAFFIFMTFILYVLSTMSLYYTFSWTMFYIMFMTWIIKIFLLNWDLKTFCLNWERQRSIRAISSLLIFFKKRFHSQKKHKNAHQQTKIKKAAFLCA